MSKRGRPKKDPALVDGDSIQGEIMKAAEADGSLNKDGFAPGSTVSSDDLLKHQAEQRQKGIFPKSSGILKKRNRKSKIHGNAEDRPEK